MGVQVKTPCCLPCNELALLFACLGQLWGWEQSLPTILAKNNGTICKINHELFPPPPTPKLCCYDAEFIYSPHDSSCAQHCLGGGGAFQKLQRRTA